jgi:hypothetical protein
MKTIKFREWELLVDKESTELTYEKIDGGISDGCPCNDCRNFVDNRKNIFPEEVKILFTELGIDYNKECENMHYEKLKNGFHSYHFWFHFKGKIVNQNNENASITYSINNNLIMSFGKIQFPTFFENTENLTQLEFYAEIPWIIEKELEAE